MLGVDCRVNVIKGIEISSCVYKEKNVERSKTYKFKQLKIKTIKSKNGKDSVDVMFGKFFWQWSLPKKVFLQIFN